MLREIWRVMASGGQLLAVVPNRRGLWARMDTTPFGHGRPYSRSQITASAARGLVHAGGLERSALRAADPARLVPALGGGLGAHRRDDLGAVRRRAYRRGDQAGLSRDSGASARSAAWCRRSSRCWRRRRAARRGNRRKEKGQAIAWPFAFQIATASAVARFGTVVAAEILRRVRQIRPRTARAAGHDGAGGGDAGSGRRPGCRSRSARRSAGSVAARRR